MNALSEQEFRLIRTGGLRMLSTIIEIARRIALGRTKLYPAWQGMQYMRYRVDEKATLKTIDNNRYTNMKWTTTKDLPSKYNIS